jgi:putative transposase
VNKIETNHPTKNSLKISSQFVTSSWPSTTDGAPLPFVEIDNNDKHHLPTPAGALVKTTKIKLHVRNEEDHERLRKLFGTVRFTYNQCVAYLRNHTGAKPNKKILRSLFVNNDSELVKSNQWLLDTGYDIRDDAISEFITSMKGNFTKLKKKTQKFFRMNFKSKKRQRSETFYVRHRWIEQRKNTIVLKLPKMKPIVLWSSRCTPTPILMDCKFQRTWTGEYYLCVPHAYGVDNQDSQNDALRVCSLDPGLRTFQTIFDATNSCAYEVAPRDIQKVVRLCLGLDKLASKRDTAPNAKLRYNYKRAFRRLAERVRNLINEVHKQLAKFLAVNYDLVIIPKFETTQMIRKGERKIHSTSVRQMTTWAHYRFRQRLIFKTLQYNCRVAVVDESWTSKTCSSCGYINHALGANKTYACPHCQTTMDRDVNGAKNIFLKNYEALGLHLTLGPTPSALATEQCTEAAMSLLDENWF